jgi:hypothetical protein
VDKAGRKGKAKESANEIKALAYYEDYKSAGYAALQLDLNRHTVERYYTKFRAKEIEQTNEEFIKRQHVTKTMVVTKMDIMIAKAQKQIARFESLIGDEGDVTPEGINFERLLQKSITDMTALEQQKAELEMTPTLDLHIAAEIEKKYAKFNEENSIIK